MVGDDREVGESRGHECRAGQVQPEHSRESFGADVGRAGLEVLRSRIEQPGDGEQREHDHGWHRQGRERRLVVVLARREDQRDEQGTEHRSELVE